MLDAAMKATGFIVSNSASMMLKNPFQGVIVAIMTISVVIVLVPVLLLLFSPVIFVAGTIRIARSGFVSRLISPRW